MCVTDRLLFASTWLLADDYGNLGGDPDWVRGQVFWGDPSVTPENVRDSLARLTREGLLLAYDVRGQPYFHVTNWHRHQRVDKPGKPRVPGPEEGEKPEQIEDSRESRESSKKVPGSLAPDRDHDHEVDHDLRQSRERPEPAAHRPRPADRFAASFAPDDPAALALFEVWRSESGKQGAKLDHKRSELFQRLAMEGVTEADVKAVVTGAKLDDWARDKAKLDPSAILGSAGQREKFAELAKCPPKPEPKPKSETADWILG